MKNTLSIAYWEKSSTDQLIYVYERPVSVSLSISDINRYFRACITEISSLQLNFTADFTFCDPIFELFLDEKDWFGGISVFELRNIKGFLLVKKSHFDLINSWRFDPRKVINSDYFLINSLDFDKYWFKFTEIQQNPNFSKNRGSKSLILKLNTTKYSIHLRKQSSKNSQLVKLFRDLFLMTTENMPEHEIKSVELAYVRSFYDLRGFSMDKIEQEINRLETELNPRL